jgi:beta-N-acetylhexosaminidase
MTPWEPMKVMRALSLALTAALLAGCAGSGQAAPSPTPATPSAPGPTPATAAPTSTAEAAPPTTGWGPSVAEWDEAGRLVGAMDTAGRAGAVIVATYSGTQPPTDLVRDLGLAGVILLGENVPRQDDGTVDAAVLAKRLAGLQEADERPYPLVVAVDQEGGPIARVGRPATVFPPAMALGAADAPSLARAAAAASGAELRALGFTMVFAPVADVTSGADDPTIGVRSPGSDPALVARIATAELAGYTDAGIVGVQKHFPGHGSVPADSHVDLPVQAAAPDVLAQRDLVPFAAAVQAGATAIMVAHIDVRALDPGVPSSLSAPVVTGLLRSDLGFSGLVVTDALNMGAVDDRFGPGDAAVAALAAGVDLLLMPTDPAAARDAVVAAVDDGRLDPARLEEAARRVVAVQLHQAAAGPAPGLDVLGTSAPLSAQVSAAALTLLPGVSGSCLAPSVGASVRVSGGTEQDRARFTLAAARAGVAVGSGPLVVLLGRPGSSGDGDVVVALDTPYGLGASRATTARVALFGRTDAAFDALLAVLTGRAAAGGRLPVVVPGIDPATTC